MKAELIDVMGDDLRVVNAARVSFSKNSNWEWTTYDNEDEADKSGKIVDYDYILSESWYGGYPAKSLSESDIKLINYLAKHNHWTPFSHVMITMREKVPLFVARQRFKHMVGFTYNERSGRYVGRDVELFTPTEWRMQAADKKQGSSDELVEDQEWHNNEYDDVLRHCYAKYNEFIENGVAIEQARMMLPQSMYTEYFVTGSLAAWARAYKLRIDSHAQKEIQDLAKQWDDIISAIPELKYSWNALKS